MPVSVTILTGFLGAGKTTLVHSLLRQTHGRRIAVMLNEVGSETGLEEPMLRDEDGNKFDGWMELNNGCVCCTVRDNMVTALEALLQRQDRAFDHIVIETTGLADPGPVASMFWVDDALESPLLLDGIVVVVDALNVLSQLDRQRSGTAGEAQRQIAFADLILLNKIDLVSPQHLEAVETRLRAINRAARIQRTTRSEIDVTQIFNLRTIAPESVPLDLLDGFTDCHECVANSASNKHTTQAPAQQTVADVHEVQTLSISISGLVSQQRLEHLLGSLLWEHQDAAELFRFKGIVMLAPDESADPPLPARRAVLQGVHNLFEFHPAETSLAAPARTALLFIGRGINEAKLTELIRSCVVD
eukprot:TRINITY_DN6818_c0_g1_i2.p1 TRINITY_DN6818_c0_g1~~TRINITY_DN6818_c0_g1_i2.p1  ORF type:complete len:359 (+),score=79.10 TRINITY_DN6818_c0_g1_i2:3-1079(+)